MSLFVSATAFGHQPMTHPELWADHVATFMQGIGDTRSLMKTEVNEKA